MYLNIICILFPYISCSYKDYRLFQYYQEQNLSFYCLSYEQSLCLFCIFKGQHQKHQVLYYLHLQQEKKNVKKLFEKIEKSKN